jgi:hypothetical protein
MSVQPALPQTIAEKAEPSILPFVAPTVVFGVLTALEGYVPTDLYAVAYAVKAVAVTAALLVWRQPLRDITPDFKVVVPSILLGLVVCVAWVGLEAIPYPHLGERVGFDPYRLPNPLTRAGFVVVRLYGLVLMVRSWRKYSGARSFCGTSPEASFCRFQAGSSLPVLSQ